VRLLSALSLLFIITFTSCKKEVGFILDNNAKLNFSEDTILFDTVFTQVGSATKQLKIYNPYKKKLLIKRIWLAGGAGSQFKLNIDHKLNISKNTLTRGNIYKSFKNYHR
jgi:hypothetical protein